MRQKGKNMNKKLPLSKEDGQPLEDVLREIWGPEASPAPERTDDYILQQIEAAIREGHAHGLPAQIILEMIQFCLTPEPELSEQEIASLDDLDGEIADNQS